MSSIPVTTMSVTLYTILYNIGILFSYAIGIGSLCIGNVQAGLIFLFCIVVLTILSCYFLSNTIKPINNIPFDTDVGVNISICSFTLLYIASSRIYNNEITSQYLGVVITYSVILLLYGILIKFIKKLPHIKLYFGIFIISSILGTIFSTIICGFNSQFALLNNYSNSSSSNSQCSTTPGNTFKCSFISSEDGTEIDLDDILNK